MKKAGAFFALAGLFLSACGKKDLYLDCGPEDQRGSYLPGVSQAVQRLVVDPRFEASVELPAIEAAARTWNALARQRLSRSFFSVEMAARPPARLPSSREDCEGFDVPTDSILLVRETSDVNEVASRWAALGLTSGHFALTVRCYADEVVQKQVVLINRRYASDPQVQSVVLHELGHSLGLDHSCQAEGGSSDWRGCENLGPGHPYFDAVMFPMLRGSAAAPERREAIQANDQERAACRYSQD